jgi:hypothetical protein
MVERSKMTLKQLNRMVSPNSNPLLEGTVVATKEKRIAAGMRKELIDPVTGEVSALSQLHRVKEIDREEFVKVFSEGVKAMYGLTRTGMRVFQAVLDEYQGTKMQGGYADTIYLAWFGDGICGRDVGMSEVTFHRGLKELILNDFLAPRGPSMYWVNPALFFKGDRVAFVKEYRIKRRDGDAHLQQDLDIT